MCIFKNLFQRDPKPYDSGFLDVGTAHQIHYMQFGNPKGNVILRFHGGPGGSAKPSQAKPFNLNKYRVILFSQRGCGLSTFQDVLKDNTPQNTIEDTIKLLKHLKITKPIYLSGFSYGTTLALLFAEKYPQKVKGLLLGAVFLARKRDIEWVSKESVRFYPDLMDEVCKEVHQKQSGSGVSKAYQKLIQSPAYKDIQKALQYYGSYEYCMGLVNCNLKKVPPVTDKAINSLKIYLEYEIKNFFLKDNEILNNINKIKDIPTVIVHNRLDMTCPVEEAYLLHKALTNSTLIINPDIRHFSDSLNKAFEKATARFFKALK